MIGDYIDRGQFFADLPSQYDPLAKNAGFVSDVHLAFTTLSIAALLYAEDKTHFQIIKSRMPSLKVVYIPGVAMSFPCEFWDSALRSSLPPSGFK